MPTETNVESGTSRSKSGTSLSLSNSGKLIFLSESSTKVTTQLGLTSHRRAFVAQFSLAEFEMKDPLAGFKAI